MIVPGAQSRAPVGRDERGCANSQHKITHEHYLNKYINTTIYHTLILIFITHEYYHLQYNNTKSHLNATLIKQETTATCFVPSLPPMQSCCPLGLGHIYIYIYMYIYIYIVYMIYSIYDICIYDIYIYI